MARQRRRASAVQGVGSKCGKVLERDSNASGVTVPRSERGAKDLAEPGGAGRRRLAIPAPWSQRAKQEASLERSLKELLKAKVGKERVRIGFLQLVPG